MISPHYHLKLYALSKNATIEAEIFIYCFQYFMVQKQFNLAEEVEDLVEKLVKDVDLLQTGEVFSMSLIEIWGVLQNGIVYP